MEILTCQGEEKNFETQKQMLAFLLDTGGGKNWRFNSSEKKIFAS